MLKKFTTKDLTWLSTLRPRRRPCSVDAEVRPWPRARPRVTASRPHGRFRDDGSAIARLTVPIR